MISMRELPRVGLEPGVVGLVRRADERQRPTERVDELLIMAMLAVKPFGTPIPARWQLPIARMRRQLGPHGVHRRPFRRSHAGPTANRRFTSSIRRESRQQPARTPARA